TDLYVVADFDVAEYLRARSDRYIVPERRMPFPLLAACTAQGDALVKQHVVADLGGFADHDARPVINEKTPADGGAGVNLNLRKETADLRNNPRHERNVPLIKSMREPVGQNGVESGITEEDLDDALRRRVFPENRLDLFPDGSKHASLDAAPASDDS